MWEPLLQSSPEEQELSQGRALSALFHMRPSAECRDLAPLPCGAAGSTVSTLLLHPMVLLRPLPSPARALPAAAALNKPLRVSLITLGCSSGSARARLGLLEAGQTVHGVWKDPAHPGIPLFQELGSLGSLGLCCASVSPLELLVLTCA